MKLERFLPENPIARQGLLWGVLVGASLIVVKVVLPVLGGTRSVPDAILFRSVVAGLIASLTTCGLVLIFRITRVINFAQVAIGATGAQLCFLFVRYTSVPFIVALVIGIGLSAIVGALFDVVFGRRFANAPRLVLTVVTITGAAFLGQQFSQLTTRLPFFPPIEGRSDATEFARPLRPYLPFSGFDFTVGGSKLEFGFPELLAIDLALLAFLGLFLFFRFSKSGVAVRAVAENVERASLLGISVGLLSTIVWAIAGALGGTAVIAAGLVQQPGQAFALSPVALLIPLAAGVITRFQSLPKSIGATIVISFVAGCTTYALTDDPGLVTFGIFVVLVSGLIFQRRGMFRTDQAVTTSWSATEEQRPIPAELSKVRLIRFTRIGFIVLVVAGLIGLPFVVDTGLVTLGATVATYAIVALSLVVLTGWAGQVSLGQFAFVAVGSVIEAALAVKVGIPFWFAVPITVALTGAIAALIGLPALRAKGLLLAVATFAFSVALVAVLFDDRYFGWLLVKDRVPRPTLFFLDFDNERNMYYLCVAAFLLAVAVVVNLRKTRVGRILIAARENEANVQSFGIPLVRTKLLAFAISGALAGFAGAVLVHQLRTLTSTTFTPEASFGIFVFTVIGGVSSVLGALLGAAFPLLAGRFAGNNPFLTLLVGFVPLLVLFTAPGGFIGIIISVRDAILRIVAQRRQIVVPSLFADFDTTALVRRLIPLAEPQPTSGLSALPVTDRYSLTSELYQGHGERVFGALPEAEDDDVERAALGLGARA